MPVLKDLCAIWKTLVIVGSPIIALPILLHDGSKEMACLYGVVIIASLWITEALPIPVTAMSPVVIFPLLGVLPARAVAGSYIKDSLVFSIVCLSVATCVEKWRLHRRIALNTLLLVGSSPKWLMLGFMLPTWLLSMVVNNTSATAMMIPVVSAVLTNLRDVHRAVNTTDETEPIGDHGVMTADPSKASVSGQDGRQNKSRDFESGKTIDDAKFQNLCKSLTLCICYSATIGGIASVTGTSTNLIMQGQAEEYFSERGMDSGVNFLSWLMCCLPISAICLLLCWIWLTVLFLGVKELFHCGCGLKEERETTKNVIKKFLKELGPLSFAEKAVTAHLLIMVALWLSIKFPGGSGWHTFFQFGYVSNSTPGILIFASLFIFPSEKPTSSKNGKRSLKSIPPLMDWSTVQYKFPWGTILLIGGGYAVAHACLKSGLSAWVASQLSSLSSFQPWLMILVLSVCISFVTEITSNAATSSLLCPILIQMAVSMNVNPLYFLFPGALACSLAFMLPVATPPNAIAFATGHITIPDMVKAGSILNFMCVVIVNMGINVWGKFIFDFDTFPTELRTPTPTNNTSFTFNASISHQHTNGTTGMNSYTSLDDVNTTSIF